MNENQLHEKIVEVSKTIFSYCMAKTSNREDAEDLSQDIIYELIRSSNNLRNDDAFYGFMWAVAGNVYRQWYKKKLRSASELSENIPDNSNYPSFGDELSDIYLLRRELALLSEKYRRATILYYIDRKSCFEISQTLSISESMVKYLLFKSRKILKEGMNMERKLGERSYNPKFLIPMYSGEGPNRFWDFMQSKIRQNIVSACFNDSLTVQQISLETGIPLPYLDDEIRALTDKQILICEGNHYKANVIVITSDCSTEIDNQAAQYHEKIAETIHDFINKMANDFKAIGFYGNRFSEKSIHWMLATLVFRSVLHCNDGIKLGDVPKTAWGERAYLYCVEKLPESLKQIFAYSGMSSRDDDGLFFFDYVQKPNGDHHDFYGNDRYVNIICDIAKGDISKFSEYDLEAVAEIIRLGYVFKDEDSYRLTVPVYTREQFDRAYKMAEEFVNETLAPVIAELNRTAVRILSDHTPKHLQNQVDGIASMDKFINGVSIPAMIMIEKGYLSTNWTSLEMPTTYIVLNK